MSTASKGQTAPLRGLRVVEMGSGITVPYVAKLLVDAGATVVKVESPTGDPLRRRRGDGAALASGEDGAFWQFLNAGKSSRVIDIAQDGLAELRSLVERADLVLDDHAPAAARSLGIDPEGLRSMHPAAVVATFTPFGTEGPWANRPANDFTMQALVGATDARGIPGEEPVACGGSLGDFVAAALGAPSVLAATLAAVASGTGAHLDASQFEAMMLAFQTYRPMYDAFRPSHRQERQIEIPSVEPAKDGLVGYCTVTGQQWNDFCAMIGADDWIDHPDYAGFDKRMERREEIWPRIRAFTQQHTVDELVELAAAFRIPTGPIGTGDVVASLDQFVERGVFVQSAHGFTQPRPPYQFSASALVSPQPAPALGRGEALPATPTARPALGTDPARPLAGMKVLDISAFWAGPVATNLLRVLGADLVKVESHVRLDGMRWASGLPIPVHEQLWEWSPVYHGANVGKRVVNLDLGTEEGREVLDRLIAEADVVIENFSPRVTEGWGVTWDRISAMNDRAVFVRIPAFGTTGPWRDRVGFAMTMEQVSGLANRTGFPDGPPLVPKGPVDSIAGMHAVIGALLALVERERTGKGQLVELALIEGALQAAAQQVIEHSAYGLDLRRIGNRSETAEVQGLYRTRFDDVWLAVTAEGDAELEALCSTVGVDSSGIDRTDPATCDAAITAWAATLHPEKAAALLGDAGLAAAVCVDFHDTGRSPQHDFRGFLQWRHHPVTGWTPYASYPVQVNGAHLDLGARAPLLGEHNHEVLAEVGVDAERIAVLEAEGVIGDWPAAVPRPENS